MTPLNGHRTTFSDKVTRGVFRHRAGLWLLLLGLGIGGCSDSHSPHAMYEKYLTRLGNVTEMSPTVALDQTPLPPYPAARDLVLETEDIRIGMIDFFSFSECQLLHDISERNSGLGRVQQATVRLRYEMRFFAKLQACLANLAQRPDPNEDVLELRRLVQDVIERKRKVLPRAYWNATFASPEIRVLLSSGSQAYRRDETLPVTELARDLAFLVSLEKDLYQGGPSISDAEFEQHYYRLQQHKTIGRLLQSLWLSNAYLALASDILRQTHEANRLCPQGNKTRRAEYLHNVFLKFYIGEVQPYLSEVHRAGQALLPVLEALHAAQGVVIPVAFEGYYQNFLSPQSERGLWQVFRGNLQGHTEAWQAVLNQCGMMPGS